MDYKLNQLGKGVKCENNLLQDIPALGFTEVNETLLFDATDYCSMAGIDGFDWRVFSRTNKIYIEGLAKIIGLDTHKLFYQEKGGHILIIQDLVFLFLAYVEPSLSVYFNNLIADALTNGVAFSDSFAVQLASNRIPTDVMRQIINDRANGEEKQT